MSPVKCCSLLSDSYRNLSQKRAALLRIFFYIIYVPYKVRVPNAASKFNFRSYISEIADFFDMSRTCVYISFEEEQSGGDTDLNIGPRGEVGGS